MNDDRTQQIELLRSTLAESGLTQEEFARTVAEVSTRTLQYWLNGTNRIAPRVLRKLRVMQSRQQRGAT